MDVYLVGILTFFAVVIGGILWWSQASASGKQSLQLEVEPEALVEMQLEEILEEKKAAAPGGNSFRFEFAGRTTYEALGEDGSKPAALLKRCIDCLQSTMAFDARVKIVYESYNNLVPREVLQFLGGVKTELTDEIEAIKTVANTLKPDWGQTIFNQAMGLLDLQRREDARVQAEEQKVVDARSKEEQKVLDAKEKEKEKLRKQREAEEEQQRKQREADRAYKALMGEAAPKKGQSTKKDAKTTSQKK